MQEQDKTAYRATMQLLASRRRLRPVFLERKPRSEQYAWLRSELSRKTNADLATEVLQTWLLGAHRAVICRFLDDLKVPHDGNGLIDALPPEPPEVKSAVERLLQAHDPLAVAIYLHVFVEMDIAHWPVLAQLLQDDPRFRFVRQPTVP